MSPPGTGQKILQPDVKRSAAVRHGGGHKKWHSLCEIPVSDPMIHEDDFETSLSLSQMERAGHSLDAAV